MVVKKNKYFFMVSRGVKVEDWLKKGFMQISSQIDSHKLGKDIATNKRNIPRKMVLMFQNSMVNIFCISS